VCTENLDSHVLVMQSTENWVAEFVLAHDGSPSYALSIMEFRDPFEPGSSRAHLVERA
jgi:hypothetical protein